MSVPDEGHVEGPLHLLELVVYGGGGEHLLHGRPVAAVRPGPPPLLQAPGPGPLPAAASVTLLVLLGLLGFLLLALL